MCIYPRHSKSINININKVGGERINVSGDKTTIVTEVKSTWGNFYSEEEFLILDQDEEDLVMGNIWYNSVMRAKRSEILIIMDSRGF